MIARSVLLPALTGSLLLGADLPGQQSRAADPWVGTFTSEQLTLTLRKDGGGYRGSAAINGQSFPVTASGNATELTGRYQADGTDYALSLSRSADGVVLTVDGLTLTLVRARGAGEGEANPAGGQEQGGQAAGRGGQQPAGANAQLVQQWQNHLAGNMAARYDRYSSGSDGGYSSSTEYHLCRNGQFLLKKSSSMSVDVGGASAFSGGNSDNSGTWKIITQGNLAGIELRFNNGNVVQARLDYQNGQTLVDGERWLIGRSEVCS